MEHEAEQERGDQDHQQGRGSEEVPGPVPAQGDQDPEKVAPPPHHTDVRHVRDLLPPKQGVHRHRGGGFRRPPRQDQGWDLLVLIVKYALFRCVPYL